MPAHSKGRKGSFRPDKVRCETCDSEIVSPQAGQRKCNYCKVHESTGAAPIKKPVRKPTGAL
jgi:hypothetical protein